MSAPLFDNPPTWLQRTLIIIAILSIMGLVAHDYMLRRRAAAVERFTVRAVAAGRAQARYAADADAEDNALWMDDSEAGEKWARDHQPRDPLACPDYSAAFRMACTAYVSRARSKAK